MVFKGLERQIYFQFFLLPSIIYQVQDNKKYVKLRHIFYINEKTYKYYTHQFILDDD